MTMAPRVRPDSAHLIPAAVHVDGTAASRPSIGPSNPRYYGLIEAFGRLTGIPVLLNTSFNRTEPIVASPADAVDCYLRTGMDVLVIGDFYTTDRGPASAATLWERATSRPRHATLTPRLRSPPTSRPVRPPRVPRRCIR